MKRQRLMTILAISAMMLFLMGAEEPCVPEFPAPPFNASGTYTGWFQVEGGEACPMIAELGQNLDVPYPQDHTVWGIYKLELSCIEVEGFENPVDRVLRPGHDLSLQRAGHYPFRRILPGARPGRPGGSEAFVLMEERSVFGTSPLPSSRWEGVFHMAEEKGPARW